jgi:hypothetical protein
MKKAGRGPCSLLRRVGVFVMGRLRRESNRQGARVFVMGRLRRESNRQGAHNNYITTCTW